MSSIEPLSDDEGELNQITTHPRGPQSPSSLHGRSPSPFDLPGPPLDLPNTQPDQPDANSILDIWEAERSHATGPLQTPQPYPEHPDLSLTEQEADSRTAVAQRQVFLNAGYTNARELAVLLRTHKDTNQRAAALFPEFTRSSWDEEWLQAQGESNHLDANNGPIDTRMLELLRKQLGYVQAVKHADRMVRVSRTELEWRGRQEGADDDAEAYEEMKQDDAGPPDEGDFASRPRAWYTMAERASEAAKELDKWWWLLALSFRWPNESQQDEESVTSEDSDESDPEEDETTKQRRRLNRKIRQAVKQPPTAHMGIMIAFDWTEADLEEIANEAVPCADVPYLHGPEWYRMLVQSLPFVGRAVEAFHGAVECLHDQNGRHGPPSGSTDALDDASLLYEEWLLPRIPRIAAHFARRHSEMQDGSQFTPDQPEPDLHATIRRAFASVLEVLREPIADNLVGMGFAALDQAIYTFDEEQLENPPWAKLVADYRDMMAFKAFALVFRHTQDLREEAIWFRRQTGYHTAHAYRTSMVRNALFGRVYATERLVLILDWINDAAMEVARRTNSTVANDVLQGLQRHPMQVDVALLHELSILGRLGGTDGGNVRKMFSLAVNWATRKSEAKEHFEAVSLHHAESQLDYLAMMLPTYVQRLHWHPSWGTTEEEQTILSMGDWANGHLQTWSQLPVENRRVDQHTVAVLHFAKLFERLACIEPLSGLSLPPPAHPLLAGCLLHDECPPDKFHAMVRKWHQDCLWLTRRIVAFVGKNKDSMLGRAQLPAEAAVQVLGQMQVPSWLRRLSLADLDSSGMAPQDADSDEDYAEYKAIKTERDALLRLELILTHVNELFSRDWERSEVEMTPSLLSAFDRDFD